MIRVSKMPDGLEVNGRHIFNFVNGFEKVITE